MRNRSEPPVLLNRLTALSDMARLRILRLLGAEELSVGELSRALQLPQSTVSRHLKLLHDGEWIVKRSEGTASLYCLVEDALAADARALWTLAREQIGTTPTLTEDDSRLSEVLASRRADSKSFFGRLGSEWDRVRHDLFGSKFTTEALLGLLPRDWIVADLGCGTGNAAEILAPFVKQIIAVDRETTMLSAARKRLSAFENVEFRSGELDDLPFDDAEVDAALTFLVLHHVPKPADAMAEMARIVRPGGLMLIVDMVAHDRESYRHTMGHQHLGFGEEAIARLAEGAALGRPTYRRLRPDTQAKGPGLFVAVMRRP